MNEIITRLNEIEEKAEAIIADAKAGKERMLVQLEQEKKEIDRKYDRMEADAMKQLKQKLEQEAKEEIAGLRQKNQEAIKKQNDAFLKHREELAEEVFRRIIIRKQKV